MAFNKKWVSMQWRRNIWVIMQRNILVETDQEVTDKINKQAKVYLLEI